VCVKFGEAAKFFTTCGLAAAAVVAELLQRAEILHDR
jgi:hypothetical protein